ncbi:hypothetical protein AUC70_04285 [Methyloceanibacter stevinii]|uniref:Uncharacterized protein n=1 Tax=Methyloceanibacter stevinii TaxID=1774970 RepID=A0A1E3VN75_9HYPH|nr:hypothetical protein AUC70_04285 [Methyloceanibacter stevinii]
MARRPDAGASTAHSPARRPGEDDDGGEVLAACMHALFGREVQRYPHHIRRVRPLDLNEGNIILVGRPNRYEWAEPRLQLEAMFHCTLSRSLAGWAEPATDKAEPASANS